MCVCGVSVSLTRHPLHSPAHCTLLCLHKASLAPSPGLPSQAALPFKTKPKLEPKRTRKTLEQKRAVVLEPHERKTYQLLQQLNTIRNDKSKKRNAHEVRACAGGSARK